MDKKKFSCSTVGYQYGKLVYIHFSNENPHQSLGLFMQHLTHKYTYKCKTTSCLHTDCGVLLSPQGCSCDDK